MLKLTIVFMILQLNSTQPTPFGEATGYGYKSEAECADAAREAIKKVAPELTEALKSTTSTYYGAAWKCSQLPGQDI